MASTDVVLAGGLVTLQGSGYPTLDGTIIETMDRDDIMPDHKQYMAIMDFNETPLLNPNQTFAAKAAPTSMGDSTETGIAENADVIFTPKKGVFQKIVSRKYTRSYDFIKWTRQAKTLQGAPDAIQAELLDTAEQTRDLALAYDSRFAEEMVKVFANGFSGGTLTPKGKNLFDTHTYGVTGSAISGTFTNYLNGAFTFDPANTTDVANGATRLQALLNLLKVVKDENGKYIKQGGLYKLYVSRIRALFWKRVLNNDSKFSGVGSNAMQENQFLFDGNIVEIVVLDLLGQVDYAGNVIGTTDQIFVTNASILKQSRALKTFRLYPLTITSWQSMETDVLNVKGRASISADHYGAELYVAGSTCAA